MNEALDDTDLSTLWNHSLYWAPTLYGSVKPRFQKLAHIF